MDVRTLLFDGESGLKSRRAKLLLLEKFNIILHADPGSKRNQAERMIRGIIIFFCNPNFKNKFIFFHKRLNKLCV